MKRLLILWYLLLGAIAAGQTKISELPALTGAGAVSTDVLPIVDVSAGAAGSKKITLAELFSTPVPWQGVVITGQYGGTGVANTGKTITLGGNLTTSGAHATTLTTTGTTSVTLPTSGTLATTDGANITGKQAFREAIGADLNVPVSDTVLSMLVAHAASNANCAPWALRQWAWSLSELEAGGILDELKEGACFRAGFNSPTAIKSIKNTTATISGTVPLTADGALFSGDSANRIIFAVTNAAVFSHVVDFRFAPDAPALSAIASLTATGGTNSSGNIILNVGPDGSFFTAAGGNAANSAAFGDAEDANSIHRYNPNDVIVGYSSDNGATPALKGYANGVPVLTDSSGNYQADSLVQLTIGAAHSNTSTYAYPMVGTVASSLLFDRVLTDAEQVIAAKASRHLDPRRINIVTYGDSRTTHLSDAAKITGDWPYQYAASPALAKTARLCNIAHNGWTASTMASNFAARGGHLGPNGTSIEESRFYLWTGANDWQAAVTGASAWSTVKTVLRAARALGMRVTLCTDPEGGTQYDSGEEAERLSFNGLVRAGWQEWDAILDLDTAFARPRNVILWRDEVHLNNTGNQWIAGYLNSGGALPLPRREDTVTLDQDQSRTSTTTLTDLAMATPTAEGLSTMGLSLAANESVGFEAFLHVTDAANPQNVKIGLSLPSGATHLIGLTATEDNFSTVYHWGGPTGVSLLATATGASILHVRGVINNGATAGNVILQGAQFASTGTAVVFKKGSTMRLIRR